MRTQLSTLHRHIRRGAESWQWQPTLVAHDPNPPITLESGLLEVAPDPVVLQLAVVAPSLSIITPGGNTPRVIIW